MFTQDAVSVPVYFTSACNRTFHLCYSECFQKLKVLGPIRGPSITRNTSVVFPLSLGLGAMAGLSNSLREQEASLLGASIYERMIQLGQSPEDAHRAAQQAVTGAFGKSSGVSATGATGSADPIPGGNGPKLPPPSQMAANLAADLAGRNQGSQPPPTPQAPPSWWGLSPGTWTAQPPPTPAT